MKPDARGIASVVLARLCRDRRRRDRGGRDPRHDGRVVVKLDPAAGPEARWVGEAGEV